MGLMPLQEEIIELTPSLSAMWHYKENWIVHSLEKGSHPVMQAL